MLLSVKRTAFCAAALTLALGAPRPASAQVSVFARGGRPLGITTDIKGNVAVHVDRTFNHGVQVYRPNGSGLGYLQLGGFTDAEGMSYLATIPSNGRILSLRQNGLISMIDPVTGRVTPWMNLRTLPTDVRAVYDLAQGRYHSFLGMVQIQNSSFGDIAILQRRGVTDLFISGMSYPQVFPFILRVRITARGVASRIIAGSMASTAGSYNAARGIAVNNRGVVAAILPYQTRAGSMDRLVTFSPDFPETRRGLPRITLGGRDMAGNGIGADRAGNFYIATGPVGTSLAGRGGSGAMVVVSPDGGRVLRIFRLNVTVGDSRDVAISPAGDRAYMTLQNYNAVVTFRLR